MINSIKYSEFQQRAVEHGYTPRIEKPGKSGEFFYVKTRNNVKTELKKSYYTIGYGLKPDELELLLPEIKDAGFTQHQVKSKAASTQCYHIKFKVASSEQILSDFWALVSIIEDIDGIVARQRGQSIKPFTKDICEQNIFEKVAQTYRFAIDIQHGNLLDTARTLLEADSIDSIITRGESVEHTEDNSYREHVVPCIMIHNRAIEMTMAGEPVAEVAQLIASNLAIVRITKEQAQYIDITLGYRTTMPPDWQWGDDIYARLRAGNIQLK